MSIFAEVTRQVKKINDMILSNMKNGKNDESTEVHQINEHLNVTKSWFIRFSWVNKKKFLLELLDDVRCIWTFSLLLKSIWNCRPKDAVMSVCEPRVWSSYDQVPMDNNRTALLSTLIEVMMRERKWFQSLKAEEQAWVLTELFTISGGPIMWEVLKRAQEIYQKHIELQLQDLQECEVVYEPPPEKKITSEPVKKDPTQRRKSSVTQGPESAKAGIGQAQKELETHLAIWASTIKSMKDSTKLEEFEIIYKDGTKKKVWKVNRPRPEAVETVDLIQLLPSSISKRILTYIPLNQLGDCARVNKYWSFIVDEMKSELVARQKIDVELEKLREIISRHDVNLGLMNKSDVNKMVASGTTSKLAMNMKKNGNVLENTKLRAYRFSTAGRKPRKVKGEFKPIRNLTDYSERLEVRGAADENIWKWCSKFLNNNKKSRTEDESNEGLLRLGNSSFPCSLMSHKLKIPLNPPMDSANKDNETEANLLKSEEVEVGEMKERQPYSLWSKDFSSLYPVCKVPSHQSPF